MNLDYVLGFAFCEYEEGMKVVLIKKDKGPFSMAGKFNGLGGKIEEMDLFGGPYKVMNRAISREFEEESGVPTNVEDWVPFGVMKSGEHFLGTESRVFLLKCHLAKEIFERVKTNESEEVSTHLVSDLESLDTMPNLEWIIPLSLDKDASFAVINLDEESSDG